MKKLFITLTLALSLGSFAYAAEPAKAAVAGGATPDGGRSWCTDGCSGPCSCRPIEKGDQGQ